jgi:hypothetical protein
MRIFKVLAFTLATAVAGGTYAAPTIVVGPGTSVAGYLPLSIFGVSPLAAVDDGVINVSTAPFRYAGQTWSSFGFATNGFLIVGGGSNGTPTNQALPDPTGPNNLLAPFWTDLALGELRAAALTDGVNTWVVFDWNMNAGARSFEAWIGVNGSEDISFVYDPADSWAGLPANLTIGAEDKTGLVGANYYYNGTGGTVGGDLRVTTRDLPVPEPGTLLLVGGGLGVLAWARPRRLRGCPSQATRQPSDA